MHVKIKTFMRIKVRKKNSPICLAPKKFAAKSLTDFFSDNAPSVIPTTQPPNADPGLIARISLSKF